MVYLILSKKISIDYLICMSTHFLCYIKSLSLAPNCNKHVSCLSSCRVNFRLKSDTDLFEIVKCKTAVSSIEVLQENLYWKLCVLQILLLNNNKKSSTMYMSS